VGKPPNPAEKCKWISVWKNVTSYSAFWKFTLWLFEGMTILYKSHMTLRFLTMLFSGCKAVNCFRIFWPFAPALLVTSLHKGVYTVLLNVTKNSNKPFRINQRGYFRMNTLSQTLPLVNWIDSKSEIILIKRKYIHFPRTTGFSKVHRLNQLRLKNSDFLRLFLYLECLELFPCS